MPCFGDLVEASVMLTSKLLQVWLITLTCLSFNKGGRLGRTEAWRCKKKLISSKFNICFRGWHELLGWFWCPWLPRNLCVILGLTLTWLWVGVGKRVPSEILSCLILSFVFWFQCLSKDIAVLLWVPDWVFIIYLSPTCPRVCVPLHLNSSCSSI